MDWSWIKDTNFMGYLIATALIAMTIVGLVLVLRHRAEVSRFTKICFGISLGCILAVAAIRLMQVCFDVYLWIGVNYTQIYLLLLFFCPFALMVGTAHFIFHRYRYVAVRIVTVLGGMAWTILLGLVLLLLMILAEIPHFTEYRSDDGKHIVIMEEIYFFQFQEIRFYEQVFPGIMVPLEETELDDRGVPGQFVWSENGFIYCDQSNNPSFYTYIRHS